MKNILIFALVSLNSIASVTPPISSIMADRRTIWNPGILSDTTSAALGPEGLPIRNMVCATLSPSGADDTNQIQTALNKTSCLNQVVRLKPGTFHISRTLTIPSPSYSRGVVFEAGERGVRV